MAQDYGTILRNLGYKLKSQGNYWQTSAVFREGDNPTAIKIYKNTGVWIDFVNGGKAKPFKALLELTLGTTDVSDYNIEQVTYERREFLSEEKIFDDKCLGVLLPDYDYFLKKEENAPIYPETQKAYSCGLATQKKMHDRVVFPIRNRNGKIHGFSGRDVTGRSPIKWLHDGKSNNWFYPYYTVHECREQTHERERIILVESIGDSMALYQANYANNLVAFTNNISPKLVARIAALNVDVIVAFNNDFHKPLKENRGLQGGLNSILKLSQMIDFRKLWFMPPCTGHVDFGEMTGGEISTHFDVTFDDATHKAQMIRLLDLTDTIKPMASLRSHFNKFRREYRFHYD